MKPLEWPGLYKPRTTVDMLCEFIPIVGRLLSPAESQYARVKELLVGFIVGLLAALVIGLVISTRMIRDSQK